MKVRGARHLRPVLINTSVVVHSRTAYKQQWRGSQSIYWLLEPPHNSRGDQTETTSGERASSVVVGSGFQHPKYSSFVHARFSFVRFGKAEQVGVNRKVHRPSPSAEQHAVSCRQRVSCILVVNEHDGPGKRPDNCRGRTNG